MKLNRRSKIDDITEVHAWTQYGQKIKNAEQNGLDEFRKFIILKLSIVNDVDFPVLFEEMGDFVDETLNEFIKTNPWGIVKV